MLTYQIVCVLLKTQRVEDNDSFTTKFDEENEQHVYYLGDDEDTESVLYSSTSLISSDSTDRCLLHEDRYYTVVNMCLADPTMEKVFVNFVKIFCVSRSSYLQ